MHDVKVRLARGGIVNYVESFSRSQAIWQLLAITCHGDLVGIPEIAAYEHELLEYATRALSTVPGLRPIGTAADKANVLSFVIPGVSIESIAKHLDKHGIAVRAGHHCAMPAQRHFGLGGTVRVSDSRVRSFFLKSLKDDYFYR